jgi:hypothetical protein
LQTRHRNTSEALQQQARNGKQLLQQITSVSYNALLQVERKEQTSVERVSDSGDKARALILQLSSTTCLPNIRLADFAMRSQWFSERLLLNSQRIS